MRPNAITRAFERGMKAGDNDRPRASNPYQPSVQPDQFAAWYLGYDEAQPRYVIAGPKSPPLSPETRKALRELARAALIKEARERGDLTMVEILEGRKLPEIERWAVCSTAYNRRNRVTR